MLTFVRSLAQAMVLVLDDNSGIRTRIARVGQSQSFLREKKEQITTGVDLNEALKQIK